MKDNGSNPITKFSIGWLRLWKTNDNANYNIEMKVKILSNMSSEAQITICNLKTQLSPWKLNSVIAISKGINLISTSYIADCSYYGASTFGTQQIGRKLFAGYTFHRPNMLIINWQESQVNTLCQLNQIVYINCYSLMEIDWLNDWYSNNVCINNLYSQLNKTYKFILIAF